MLITFLKRTGGYEVSISMSTHLLVCWTCDEGLGEGLSHWPHRMDLLLDFYWPWFSPFR